MDIAAKIKSSPYLKKKVHRMLIPRGEARPRWWVKTFVNRWYHSRGKGSKIRTTVRRDVLPFNRFVLGRDSVVEDFSVINNGMGEVCIGDRSFIGMSNVLIGPLEIGNNVITAQHVVLSGLNHGYSDPEIPVKDQPCATAKILVGDDCWIGANVVITAGVTIGKHAVIAAGSVVTKSVPDYCVAGGNPARILKQYNFKEKIWEKISK